MIGLPPSLFGKSSQIAEKTFTNALTKGEKMKKGNTKYLKVAKPKSNSENISIFDIYKVSSIYFEMSLTVNSKGSQQVKGIQS